MSIKLNIKRYPILVLGTYGFEYPKSEKILVLDKIEKDELINKLIEVINSENVDFIIVPQTDFLVELFSTIDFKHYIIIPENKSAHEIKKVDVVEKEKVLNHDEKDELPLVGGKNDVKSILKDNVVKYGTEEDIDLDSKILFTIPNCKTVKVFKISRETNMEDFLKSNCSVQIRQPLNMVEGLGYKVKTNIIEEE